MRRCRLVLCSAVLAMTPAVGAIPAAGAAPDWAPAETATVHPGVQTFTDGAQCTANFVFVGGADVYVGQAAHCAGTGGNTETDGCTAGTLPIGTPVEVTGATRPGTIVYSSWVTMQQEGETDPDACAYNDLALIRLDPVDHARVNPSVPHWGGPSGVDLDGTAAGEAVYSYGSSSLRFGITTLSPKQGVSLGSQGGGWSHAVYTLTPGIPGDSGSAFLDAEGRALGVLSTLALAPLAGSNGVSDLGRMLAYVRAHTTLDDVLVADGTESFAAGSVVG